MRVLPPTNVIVAWVRFRPPAIRGLSFFLILAFFLSWFSSFLPSAKSNTSNSNSTRTEDPHKKPAKADLASSVNTAICFIILHSGDWRN